MAVSMLGLAPLRVPLSGRIVSKTADKFKYRFHKALEGVGCPVSCAYQWLYCEAGRHRGIDYGEVARVIRDFWLCGSAVCG